MLLLLAVLFGLAACGTGSVPDDSEPTIGQEASSQSSDGQTASSENADEESAEPDISAEDLAYGNDPNNLFQSEQAPCFGDGRLYFITSTNEVASMALDGSDTKVHGVIGSLTEDSTGASYLNWYNGNVYYIITQYREDYTRYLEVRAMNVDAGTEAAVLTCEDSAYITDIGMLIIGDNLLYSGYDAETKRTSIYVYNLATQETNLLMNEYTKGIGSSCPAFTANGRYLYILLPNTYGKIYRMALSDLYKEEPAWEELIGDIPMKTVLLSEKGIYAVVEDDEHKADAADFVFYSFDLAAADWPYEVIAENILDADKASTEEEIVKSLAWSSSKWQVGDGTVLSPQREKYYYSPSADFTQSALVGALDSSYGDVLHVGVYENVLYIILESESGTEFHTLTVDGAYQQSEGCPLGFLLAARLFLIRLSSPRPLTNPFRCRAYSGSSLAGTRSPGAHIKARGKFPRAFWGMVFGVMLP